MDTTTTINNSFMQAQLPILEQTFKLRYDLLAALSDADLAYRLPGENPTFGELCRQMGEVEHSYVQSIKTLKHDYTYQHPDMQVATSVDALKAWFDALEADFKVTVNALSDKDFNKPVDRGYGFTPTVAIQYHLYREAVLMFYARASVYLKAIGGKHVSDQWQGWIG